MTPERIYNWRDSQLSIARHYGGITFNGSSYLIAYAEDGQPLVRADVIKRKAAKKAESQVEQLQLMGGGDMSTRKWPTVPGICRRKVTIWHAQAWAGNPDLHSHEMLIGFGWSHEINPFFGLTWSVYETEHKVKRLCDLVDGKNLNSLMPEGMQPTVENLACWLLVRAPAFYDYIEVDCYDGYKIAPKRSDIPDHWRRIYLQESAPESLTV